MRSLLLIIVVLTWLVLGWLYSSSQWEIKPSSAEVELESENMLDDEEMDASQEFEPTNKKESVPVSFKYSDDSLQLESEWEDYKEKLLDELKDEEILQITALYSEDEAYSGTAENLGVARADEIRKSLDLAPEEVQLRGLLKDTTVDDESSFDAISFRNIIVNNSIDESIENRTIIRFPSNSINKLDDQVVEEYLDKLVVRVKKSGEKVKLTGFSDSDGLESDNKILGQRRADVIKQYLISKGVSEENVITLSKGELDPIALNDTEAGKAQNRRTELEIIK